MEFKGNWPEDVKAKFLKDVQVIEDFISPEDESSVIQEIEPYLKRMRYERDHWDDAIQGD
jgi:alkylated DNA repair protein alkB family protein 7